MNKTTKLNEKIVELASLPSKSTLAHKKFTDRRNFSAVSANSLLVEKYLKKLDWKVKENSNMTYSVQGLNNYLASEICKNYWLEKIISQSGKIVVTDVRIKHEYDVFKSAGAISIRIEATREIRESRGGKLIGENDVTEVDLDNIQDWDFLIDNNKDYETLKENVLKIVAKIR